MPRPHQLDPNGPTAPRPRQAARPLPEQGRPHQEQGRAHQEQGQPWPGQDRPRPAQDPPQRQGPAQGQGPARGQRPRPEQGRPPYAPPNPRPAADPFFPPHLDQHGLAPYSRPAPPGPYGAPGPAGPHGHPYQPPFPPRVPPPAPSGNSAASVLWALAPLLTCGAATPFTMAYAAAKLRSTMLALSAAIYAIGMVAVVVGLADNGSDFAEALAVIGSTGSWLVGTIHSLVIRRKVFERTETPNDHAVAFAQHRRELRQQARELVERDPSLARELRIGRPDLPRQYDDGGLVDVNHAPVNVIAGLPGMTPELAERVAEVRANVGGFISAEDMSIAVDLPPRLTAELLEMTIYLP
ncbi:hypothetical protein ACWEN6_05965 [Sphaerisporangium sp. NPDC004334]